MNTDRWKAVGGWALTGWDSGVIDPYPTDSPTDADVWAELLEAHGGTIRGWPPDQVPRPDERKCRGMAEGPDGLYSRYLASLKYDEIVAREELGRAHARRVRCAKK